MHAAYIIQKTCSNYCFKFVWGRTYFFAVFLFLKKNLPFKKQQQIQGMRLDIAV